MKSHPIIWRLRRHPIPIVAHFEHCLVLTYALPRQALEPLLPPGLVLDTFGEYGFVAVAMVKTRGLRPSFLPGRLFGQSFVLTGYRIFTRFRTSGADHKSDNKSADKKGSDPFLPPRPADAGGRSADCASSAAMRTSA